MHIGRLPDRQARLKNKRVLLVEDEAMVAMLIEDELRDAGADVLGPAHCVAGALRLVEAAAADGGIGAAVLDINMNGRHVSPVADRLAALGVPFVFATGYRVGPETAMHGHAPVLEKPFDPQMLVAIVEALAAGAGAAPAAAEAGRAAQLSARLRNLPAVMPPSITSSEPVR